MPRAKLSLNLATIRTASFDQKIQAVVKAGFSAVGLWYDEIKRWSDYERREFRLSDLRVSEMVGVTGWMDLDRMTRTIALARAEEVFAAAADLYCQVVVAEPDRREADPVETAGYFADLCRLAAPSGIKVGLHFDGAAETVKDIRAAWQVVEAAEAPNGGLVIDTFHYFLGGSTPEMLDPVPGDRILLIQLSDCLELPRYELTDRHRLYPGAGAIPLDPLLAVLGEKGFDGYYSLELMNEDYWLEDPVLVAQDGMRALRRLGIT